jgi:hypothetical protein
MGSVTLHSTLSRVRELWEKESSLAQVQAPDPWSASSPCPTAHTHANVCVDKLNFPIIF